MTPLRLMLGFSAALHLGVFVAASQGTNPAPVPSPVSAAPIPVDEMVVETAALDEHEKAEPSAPPPATPAPAVAHTSQATPVRLAHLPVVETAASSTDDAPVVPATAAALPHFTLAAGTVTASTVVGARLPTGASGGESSTPSTTTFGESAVDVPARLVSRGRLSYPDAARLAEIEADVPLDIVVDTAGKVIDARAATHVGYGLDQAATNAIFGYRFTPALRGGHPVRVRMRWSVVFRLN